MAIIEQGTGIIEGAIGPWYGEGAPTDGTSGTYAGKIPKGAQYQDLTNAVVYVNVGTQLSPAYVVQA